MTAVTIVLVNYNGFSDTALCLKSLSELTSNVEVSLVLVDNASKNASRLEELKDTNQNLHIIYNQENVGFGRANNIGIKWAKEHLNFDYLCLLNNDTIVEPDFLEHLIEPFLRDSEIGITTGKIYYESNRDVVWYGGADIDPIRGWPKVLDYNQPASENGADRPRYVSFVSGCLMFFSKASINTLRGFDEQFFMYCEDLELCLRATDAHLRMYYEPRCKIYHKVQGSSNSESVGMRASNPNLGFVYFNMKSNQYLANCKHRTGIALFIFVVVFHLELVILTVRLLFKGRKDIIPVYFRVLRSTFN